MSNPTTWAERERWVNDLMEDLYRINHQIQDWERKHRIDQNWQKA